MAVINIAFECNNYLAVKLCDVIVNYYLPSGREEEKLSCNINLCTCNKQTVSKYKNQVFVVNVNDVYVFCETAPHTILSNRISTHSVHPGYHIVLVLASSGEKKRKTN